jgi:hypothetical protein
MADITMCSGRGCPTKKKKECYRYTAPKGMWQSYFMAVPYDKEKKTCEYYWPTKKV